MSKKELFKKYQEILLKTNGGVDDYVVALCQISNLIKDYAEEKDQQICDLEAKLKALQNGIIDDKTLNMLVKEHKLYKDLETKLAESESKRKSLEEKIKFLTEETEENFVDGQKYNQLKHQLEKSEKLKESYRLQNEQHHLQLLQFYSRLGVEAFGADIHEKALETLMIMKEQLAEKEKENLTLFSMLYETLEKQGCENVASQIDQMTGWTYDKEADWLKGNRNYDQLKQQLAEKDKEIERLNLEFETQEDWQEQWQKLYDETCNLNQDKISFAVSELEKVKETAECVLDNALKNSSLNESYYDRLLDEIDNQINELKEMK